MNDKKTALITGIFGMDAQNLARILLEKNYEVIGTYRYSSIPIEQRKGVAGVKLVCSDLTDSSGVARLVAEYQPDLIFNLGAMSHVHFSFLDPISTFNADALGPLNFLEAIRLHSPHSRFYQACHDTETKVLTPFGAKTYLEIQPGDLVTTINEQTKKVEFKKVKKVHVYDYDGEMVKIKSRRINQLITPNHTVLLEQNNIINRYLADELDTVDRAHLPIPIGKDGTDDEYIDLSQYVEPPTSQNHYKNLIWMMETSDLLYLLGIFIGDGWIKNLWRKACCGDRVQNRNNKGQFIESKNTLKYQKITSTYVQIAVPETDPARKKIISILDKYNILFQLDDININFSSYTLSSLFRLSGTSAHNKSIPDFCWQYNSKLLQSLFDGLIDSDGSIRDSRVSYSTVSKTLSYQVMVLAKLLGHTTTIGNKTSSGCILKDGREIKGGKSFGIHVNNNNISQLYQKKYVSRIEYTGKVWCLEVEDNHNFLIERGGKTAFSGNSTSEMFGMNFEHDKRGPYQSIKTPFKPSSPYGVAKLAAHHLVNIYRGGYDMFAVGGILFNHTDYTRTPTFFERKVSMYAAKLQNWLKKQDKVGFTDKTIVGKDTFPKLALGTVEGVYRDIGWSYDYMRAALMMLEADEPKDYVVATGNAYPIIDILKIMMGEDYTNYYYVEPDLVRPVDVPYLRGDSRPIQDELGWKPTKTFEELMQLLLENDLYNVNFM